MADRAEYEFTTTDRVKHLLWPVTSAELVERIMRCYESVEQLYIADGHHRISSSTLLNERSPNEMNQRFMALLMSEQELHLSPFSRIVSRGKETKEEVFHSLAVLSCRLPKVQGNCLQENINSMQSAVGGTTS